MRCLVAVLFAALLVACDAPPPQPTPRPTPTPAPTPTREAALLALAQDGALPVIRGGQPVPEWEISTLGAEVSVRFPMTIGGDNAQTVRQAQTQAAGIVKRLFDGDATLMRVNAIGTLPQGAGELPAVSIVVERTAFAIWDGAAANLGAWQISPRLQ